MSPTHSDGDAEAPRDAELAWRAAGDLGGVAALGA